MRIRRLAALILSLLPLAAAADSDDIDELQNRLGKDWVEVRDDRLHSIRTWIKQEDHRRFRSFKVDAVLDGSLEAYARVLLDFDNYRKWYWEVMESRLLKKVSPTEYYVYLRHRTPYGIPNRDVVLHATVEPQARGRNWVTLTVKADPDYMDARPPLVRMAAEDMVSRFTPLPGNKVHVEIEGYVDPGGKVPAWANNFVQRAAPYSIMLSMQRMLDNELYTSGRIPLPFPILGAEMTSMR